MEKVHKVHNLHKEMKLMSNGILTKDDLCKILKVKLTTINYLTTSRQLPYFKVGKECRYFWDDVSAFIEDKMNRPNYRYIDPNRVEKSKTVRKMLENGVNYHGFVYKKEG